MRNWVAASLFGVACLAAAPASAMPVAPLGAQEPGVTFVAQGCGPGGWRGPYGRCHWAPPPGAYAPRPYYGPPRVYGYGYHPYARHCWWRGGVRVCN